MSVRLSVLVLIAFAFAIAISSDVTRKKIAKPSAATKTITTTVKTTTTASTPTTTPTTSTTTPTTPNTAETASNTTVKPPTTTEKTPNTAETASNTTVKPPTTTETTPTTTETTPNTTETTSSTTVKPPTTTGTTPNTTETTSNATVKPPTSTTETTSTTATIPSSTETTPSTTVTPNTTETTTDTIVTLTTTTATTTETAPTTTPETTTTGCTSTPDVTTTTLPPDGIPKFVLIDNGTACIILKANLQLYITYFSDNSSLTKQFTVNDDVKVSGSCKSEEERITLQWLVGQSVEPFNLVIKLVQLPRSPSNLGGSVVRAIHFEYFLSSDVFPSTNSTGHRIASVEGSFFETPAAMGFTCSAQQNITMGLVVLGVSHLHLEAFRNSSSMDFNEKALDCMDIPSSNQVVPIIVGVTAAILILLAISAFFIGNRRRAQGYQVL